MPFPAIISLLVNVRKYSNQELHMGEIFQTLGRRVTGIIHKWRHTNLGFHQLSFPLCHKNDCFTRTSMRTCIKSLMSRCCEFWHLFGAARTQKLVEILFFTFSTFFVDFYVFGWKINQKHLKPTNRLETAKK